MQLPEMVVKGAESGAEGYTAPAASTATKTVTPILETPQSISVVTDDLIEAQNAENLDQALRYVSGVQSEPFGFDPRLTFIRIRGFDVSSFGLYRDGLQLSNPGFNALGFGSFNLEPYGAQRIDVFKGPASILYGQGNPGGMVNLVTKRPVPRHLGEVEFEAGSYEQLEGKLDIGGPIDEEGEFSWRLTGLVRDSDTQVDFIENNRIYVAPAFGWRPTDRTSLTLLGHFQTDETRTSQRLPAEGTLLPNPNGEIPVKRFLGEPDVDRYERDEYSLGYLFEHQFNPTVTVRQNARYGANKLDHIQIFGIGLQPDQRTMNRSVFTSDGDLDAYVIDNQAQFDFDTGPVTHTALGGFDYQNAHADAVQGSATAQALGGTTPPIDVFDPQYGADVPLPQRVENAAFQEQFGVYLQDQIDYQNWVLTVSGRHDWSETELQDNLFTGSSSQDDEEFSGRAGLLYRFQQGVAPYYSYSTSFLPAIGTGPDGDPFEPETARQHELGIKYQPPGSNSHITASLFELTRENFLQPANNPPFFMDQTGEMRSRGIELEGVASLDFGLDVIATYTFLDAEITESGIPTEEGERPPQTPEHMASLWGDYTFQGGVLKGLGFGTGVRYTGSTYGDTPNSLKVPDFVLVDAGIHYDWNQFGLQVNVQNLLDNKHVASAFGGAFATFGAARTVTGSISYRW